MEQVTAQKEPVPFVFLSSLVCKKSLNNLCTYWYLYCHHFHTAHQRNLSTVLYKLENVYKLQIGTTDNESPAETISCPSQQLWPLTQKPTRNTLLLQHMLLNWYIVLKKCWIFTKLHRKIMLMLCNRKSRDYYYVTEERLSLSTANTSARQH